jgi:hypothetical protein
VGPFWAKPNEFLTGLSAAAGIAVINSIGNFGGFIGPSVVGTMSSWAGSVYRWLSLVGVPLLVSAYYFLFELEFFDKYIDQ